MLGFFPRLLPDELLYSGIARYQERAGYRDTKALLRDLFGKPGASILVDVPHSLENLVEVMPTGHGYSSQLLIDQHTLFPFYSPFLPLERVGRLRQAMRESGTVSPSKVLGVTVRFYSLAHTFRFCPMCIWEDTAQFGEPYWHRLHQIHGVEVCPTHEIFLENSGEREVRAWSTRYLSAARVPSVCVPRPIDKSNPGHILLLDLARDISWLLNQKGISEGGVKLRNRFLRLLHSRGYVWDTYRIKNSVLSDEIDRWSCLKFLTGLGYDLGGRGWPASVLTTKNHFSPPIYYLLLMRFLDCSPEQFFATSGDTPHPFGGATWPCLNRASRHYRSLTVHDCNVEMVGGRPRGIFSCSQCGYTYRRRGPDVGEEDQFRVDKVLRYGQVWEQRLSQLFCGNSSVGTQMVARELGVSKATVIEEAVRLELPLTQIVRLAKKPLRVEQSAEWEAKLTRLWLGHGRLSAVAGKLGVTCMTVVRHVHRLRLPYPRPVTTSKRLSGAALRVGRKRPPVEEQRADWHQLMNQNPDADLRELKKGSGGELYRWLFRHDREWLHSVCAQRKALLSTVERGEQDKQLAGEVVRAVERIRQTLERPKRVTANWICREMGRRPLTVKVLCKLPLTREALERAKESPKDFWLRRVRWAFDLLTKEGDTISFTSIRRKAGLKYCAEAEPAIELVRRLSEGSDSP